MDVDRSAGRRRLIAYVGSYGAVPGSRGGGIFGLEISPDGRQLKSFTHAPEPREAGYLRFAPETRTLYAVDERKTDGRGPVDRPAAVHSLAVDPTSGALTWLNSVSSPGPRPTHLDYSAGMRLLLSANHGDFQHVEKVVRRPDGSWEADYIYDDSTVVVYTLAANGAVDRVSDVQVLGGHGMDPNGSPQNGGHAQSGPHAHCAVIDPSGAYVLVCDKGTDRILVYRLGPTLQQVSALQFQPETAPRHLAFDPETGLAFATLELSSQLASLRFAPDTGQLTILASVPTTADGFAGHNEPAEVRVHPRGGHVYANNRGEDSLAWFRSATDGSLKRRGSVKLAKSVHPGLAARSFSFDPTGSFLLVADRPAHRVRSFAVDGETGALGWLAEAEVPDPAFIEFVTLE